MPKPNNLLRTVQIKISANALIEYHLEQLVLTGAYGNNPTEAAGIVLSREIGRLLESGLLQPPPSNVVENAKN